MIILNAAINLNFEWSLDPPEVDLLSILIKGKRSKLTEDDIEGFLSGVLDSLVLMKVTTTDRKDQRAIAILAQKQLGKDDEYIKRYIKGWDSAGEVVT